MNIRLMKRLDASLGRLLAGLLPPSPLDTPDGCSPPGSILLIRPGGIGDAVLLAPAVGALRQAFPEATLTVLAERRNAGVLPLIKGIDRALRYDVARELVAAVRLRFDLVIDTEQYHRLSAVVARCAGAGIRIGFATNERARLFHHRIAYSHDEYEASSFFHLLAPLSIGAPETLAVPFLFVPAAAQTRAVELLAPVAGKPVVVLFPGASIPERRWGAARFSHVAAGLGQRGYAPVVVGGREDSATGRDIVATAGGLNLAGKTTLVETAAIVEQAALLISGDSGVLHLGVGLDVPTVSLFGPGIAPKWAPRGERHRVVNQHLPCSPCTRFGYTQSCPGQAECLHQITPEMVLAAALSLLPS